MSYVGGMVQQRESLASSQFFRPSVVDASLADRSLASAMGRSTNGTTKEGPNLIEDNNRILPGTKIDLHILANVEKNNKCIAVEDILSTRSDFLSKVREQRRTYLVKDLNLLTKNIGELKLVLCSILSFFIVQHQIEEAYPDPDGFRQLLDLFQSKVESHFVDITKYGCSTSEILQIKKLLHFCAHICAKKSMASEEAAFLESNFY